MITIFGGVYTERCLVPPWHQIYGSGGRAAAALSKLSDNVRLCTYLAAKDMIAFKSVAAVYRFHFEVVEVDTGIAFNYFHGLSVPHIAPAPSKIVQQPPIIGEAECALRFGFMEGDAIVKGGRVVYDPQSASSPQPYRDNGSEADVLAYVLNKHEGSLFCGSRNPTEICKYLHKEHQADVVVLKMGPRGALISDGGKLMLVPCLETDNVWPLGSGDVFAAIFSHYWAEKNESAEIAAMQASKATAYYCNTSTLPIPFDIDKFIDSDCIPESYVSREGEAPLQVYLAGPFFNVAERWLIEEVRNELQRSGLKVFSPLHDVGPGKADDVAVKDLKGVDDSQLMFAILNGLDPGTVYEIGYARAKGIPVIVLSQNEKEEDLKMIEGSGCFVENDLVKAIYKTMWVANKL